MGGGKKGRGWKSMIGNGQQRIIEKRYLQIVVTWISFKKTKRCSVGSPHAQTIINVNLKYFPSTSYDQNDHCPLNKFSLCE